jgi:REP element-mobilizing transposase RayT
MPRIYIEGSLYYITLEGDRGCLLFKDGRDKEKYLRLLSHYKKKYKFKLFSFLLLPDKIFLLLEPTAFATISKIMHALNSNYSKYFNNKYNLRGHLFKERYKAKLAEKELYLLELSRYIHLLPRKLNLVRQSGNYKWSSYPLYLNSSNELNLYLSRFNLRLERKDFDYFCGRREAYQKFVEAASREEINKFGKKIYRRRILGKKSFVDRAKKICAEKKNKAKPSQPKEVAYQATKAVNDFSQNFYQKAKKRPRLVLVSLLLVFFTGAAYLSVSYVFQLKRTMNQALTLKQAGQARLEEKVESLREEVKKELGEKYRADIISYRAMKAQFERIKAQNQNSDKIKGGI